MDQVLCLSNHVFLVHVVATIFMCGLCWFVQVVHYPPLPRNIVFRSIKLRAKKPTPNECGCYTRNGG